MRQTSQNRRASQPFTTRVGAVPDFKPFRDRTVYTRGTRCPYCDAAPGDPCVTAKGTPMVGGSYHRERRRQALRDERARGEQ